MNERLHLIDEMDAVGYAGFHFHHTRISLSDPYDMFGSCCIQRVSPRIQLLISDRYEPRCTQSQPRGLISGSVCSDGKVIKLELEGVRRW